MEKDLWLAPKCFGKTIGHFRRRKRGDIQAIYSKDRILFTSNEEVIWQWKEHFEALLNLTNPPSKVETGVKIMGYQRQFPWRKSLW